LAFGRHGSGLLAKRRDFKQMNFDVVDEKLNEAVVYDTLLKQNGGHVIGLNAVVRVCRMGSVMALSNDYDMVSAQEEQARLRQPAQQFQNLFTSTWQLVLFMIFEGAFQMCLQALLFLVHVQCCQPMAKCVLQLVSIGIAMFNAFLQIISECKHQSWMVSQIDDVNLEQELRRHADRMAKRGVNPWPSDGKVYLL